MLHTTNKFLLSSAVYFSLFSQKYRVVFLRHGESIWNKENRFTGWTDVKLSANGININNLQVFNKQSKPAKSFNKMDSNLIFATPQF